MSVKSGYEISGKNLVSVKINQNYDTRNRIPKIIMHA